MTAKKRKPKRRGRPSRAAASAKALAALDVSTTDPRAILQAIAADTSAPATARVQACRALLQRPDGDTDDDANDAGNAAVTALAIKILGGRK